MSRFLTPSKVCLLLLIHLYRDGSVPLKSTIPVLGFISSHILCHAPDSTSQPAPRPSSLQDFRSLLSTAQSGIPGRSLYDLFLELLWELQDFVTFTDFLQNQTEVTTQSQSPESQANAKLVCSPTSPIGQFTRRCHLESIRLQFSDAYQLWEDFVVFREQSKATIRLRNSDSAYSPNAPNAASTNLLRSNLVEPSPILLDHVEKHQKQNATTSSLDDVDKVMQFQLQQLQKYGDRVPDEMKERLRTMVEQGGNLPSSVHFINFFDAWRSGAYNDAIELLHRYFDYTMEGHGAEHNIRTYHQYALLHLAVLHADYGCHGEAISAMNECIATARENQDARCLQFSLSWLTHLRKAYPDFAKLERNDYGGQRSGNESDIITFLQQKAAESKDWASLSSSHLSQAEAIVEQGGSVAKSVEHLYQASYLNNMHNIGSMIPSQLRLHSAILNRLGQEELAEQYCKIVHGIYGATSSKPNALSTILQHAYMRTMAGEYDEALNMLMENDPISSKTLRLDDHYIAFAAMIKLRRALHRHEMFAAEQLLRQVRPVRKTADAGTIFETHVLEIEYLLRRRMLSAAYNYIEDRIDEMKSLDQIDILRRIKLLILKARVFAKAGVPSKGFSIILRAASSAHRALLLPVLWEAIGGLCVILLDLGEYEAVKKLIDAIMPQVLEGGNEYLVGQLYGLLTDAYVGLAGHACERGSKESDRHINAASLYLERAKEAYARVEDLDGTLETIAKKGALFRYRGEDELADDMDELYAQTLDEAEKREGEARGLDLWNSEET